MSPVERVYAKISPEPNTGCWLWTGHVAPNGQPQVAFGGRGRIVGAHRVVWEAAFGQLRPGMCLYRACGVPGCVNPEHHTVLPLAETTRVSTARRRGSERSRFERLVSPEPNTGCWLWAGRVMGSGYGEIRLSRKHSSSVASRISWEMYRGPIPTGLFVCHKCDTRSCVNPDHLFLGTAQDNTDDMVRKGRHVAPPAWRRAQVVPLRRSGLMLREIAYRLSMPIGTVSSVLCEAGETKKRRSA